MKRFISVLLLALTVATAVAGNPSVLFDEFRNEPSVEYTKVPRMLLLIGRLSGDFRKEPMANKLSGLKVLSLDSAPVALRSRFEARLRSETEGCDELVSVKENGNRVRVFSKIKGSKLRNLYVFVLGDDDCSFMELSGKFTADDLRKIMKDD